MCKHIYSPCETATARPTFKVIEVSKQDVNILFMCPFSQSYMTKQTDTRKFNDNYYTGPVAAYDEDRAGENFLVNYLI